MTLNKNLFNKIITKQNLNKFKELIYNKLKKTF